MLNGTKAKPADKNNLNNNTLTPVKKPTYIQNSLNKKSLKSN